MMRKQFFALVLLAALLTMIFAGCAEEKSDLIGTWALEYALVDGEKEYAPGNCTYRFNEDGTGKISYSASSESDSIAIKWVLDDDTLILSQEVETGDWSQPMNLKILKLTATELQLEAGSGWVEEASSVRWVLSR